MTQMVISSTQTVSLELAKGQVYTIIVSKPYTWQLSFSGNGAVNNNTYTFETPNSDTSTTTYGITVSGGDIPNNWWEV